MNSSHQSKGKAPAESSRHEDDQMELEVDNLILGVVDSESDFEDEIDLIRRRLQEISPFIRRGFRIPSNWSRGAPQLRLPWVLTTVEARQVKALKRYALNPPPNVPLLDAKIALGLKTRVSKMRGLQETGAFLFLSSPILSKPLSLFNHNGFNGAISFTKIHHHHRHGPRSTNLSQPVAKFDENDVVVLTDKNFSDFVNQNQYVMLKFYALWCYWSRKLAPEYAAAATMVKGSNKAVLAKIDATHELELARKFKIHGYPTMYFLAGGVQKIPYYGERTRDAVASWVNQKINNVVQNLTTREEAKYILREKSLIVLGFLENLEVQDSKELAAVSEMHFDVNFYQTSNGDVAKLFHIDEQIKRPALVTLKKEDRDHIHFGYEGEFTRSSIADFVSTYKLPSLITFTPEDATNIFENPMKKIVDYHTENGAAKKQYIVMN
ncbi:hypothetical protein JCGZ_18538 [Jatropha curcas]|uniref:protein disulfide-isomerase n=1 Tax=Jatropha curcas TaxID=180498 RepID=A0A067L9F7_JATCU|nr:hypothetical protein JCGZ_18538 [Jatropha curcas]